jgi:hypothetical protein
VAVYVSRLFFAFLISLGLAAAAHAADMSPDRLRSIIADLGYEPTVEGSVVTLADQGVAKKDIRFSLSDDKTILNIYSNWAVDAAKRAAMPTTEMLKANSNAAFAFATFESEGNTYIDLEASYDTSLVNKKMLRHAIDQLLEMTDANEALWNQDKWAVAGAAAAPASPEAARALYDALWDAAPMRADNTMFTTTDTDNYGAYTKRANATFKTGERVFTYFEAKNFARKPIADGKYAIGFTLDTTLTNPKGEIVLNKKGQVLDSQPVHAKRSEFMFGLSLGFGDLPSGDYVLTYIVHDANSAKTMEVKMPFTIVAG